MHADIIELREEHLPALETFLGALPDGDATFIKEDVRDPQTAAAWARPAARGHRWMAVEGDGTVLGLVSITPLVGWSAHVGELRLVVDPARRGRGIGASLARHALRVGGKPRVFVEDANARGDDLPAHELTRRRQRGEKKREEQQGAAHGLSV